MMAALLFVAVLLILCVAVPIELSPRVAFGVGLISGAMVAITLWPDATPPVDGGVSDLEATE